MIRPTLALFVRALREDNRAKFPTIIRTVAVLFLLLLVWMNESDFAHNTAPGLALLTMIAMVNFFGLTITGIGMFCSAITEEKEDGTLSLLRMTRLNPLAIVLGKSTARLTSGLLFIAVQIPFTVLCIALGGTSFAQIFKVYAILGAYLFFLCNLGLLWSVLSRRTSRAVGMTLLTLALIYVLPFILYFSTGGFLFGMRAALTPLQQLQSRLVGANPFFDLISTVVPFWGFPFAADSIAPSLMGGLVCFLIAWAVFDRFSSEAATTRSPRKPGSRKRRFPRPWRLAIAWKDFQFGLGGKRGILIRLIIYAALLAGILGWIHHFNHLSQRDVGGAISTVAVMIFSVELGILASRIFGTERKRKTLGSLYVLPSSTASLIGQKILGTVLTFIPCLVLWIAGQMILDASPHTEHFALRWSEVSSALALALSRYIVFAVLVAYLSLRMRKGALLIGLLAIFLELIITNIVLFRFVFGRQIILNGNDWQTAISHLQLTVAAILLVTSLVLALLIPRRLAICAAED